jgi:hypothetical protein
MSQLALLTFTVVLVDVAASIAGTPVVVEVVANVAVLSTVSLTSRLIRVVLVDLLLDGWEVAAPRSIGSTARMTTQKRCGGLVYRAFLFHLGRGESEVGHGCFSFRHGVVLLETCHGGAQVGLRAVERR